MCEILSRVTSRCISSVYIDITSDSSEPTKQGELSEGLSRLDAVLSLPVFDNLVNVSIQPSLVVANARMKGSMKACLTRLRRRGILKIEVEELSSIRFAIPLMRVNIEWKSKRASTAM